MTFDKLILTLGKIKTAKVNGKTILRPVTKEQATILDAFGIPLPDYDTLKPTEPKNEGEKT